MKVRCRPPALCLAVLCLTAASPEEPLQGQAARSIASLKQDELARLPDNTAVRLESGQTVTLGTLRREHEARLQRFSRGEELGRAVVVRPLTRHQAGSRTQSRVNVSGASWQPATREGVAPKDYVDFCRAADATACLYLPAGTSYMLSFPGQTKGDVEKGVPFFARDYDPFIFDHEVCKFDGGISSEAGRCFFYYPFYQVVDFFPQGSSSTEAACPPPANYLVDPKGAIRMMVGSWMGQSWKETSGTPISCVVRIVRSGSA